MAKFAATLSNVGGLGTPIALSPRTPEGLRAKVERCRPMTNGPFRVSLTFLPMVSAPDAGGYLP